MCLLKCIKSLVSENASAVNLLILKVIQMLIVLVIFLLLTQNISIQTKFVKVLNCFKNSFSVLHVNTRSTNKNFEALKKFYLKLNCTFSLICFRNIGLQGRRKLFYGGGGGS